MHGPLNVKFTENIYLFYELGATLWHWLRQGATSQKLAGSIPDSVVEFFIDVILPAALWLCGSKEPLTEISTTSISLGWGVKVTGA